jgi:uncharacterized cysteine cluster protein YcgN (CxxCxxCC family)
MNDQFWKRKSLSEMTAAEWESLCDGCGLCCMLKVQDEDTGDVFYTDVACRLFDIETCRCTDYANRAKQVADCLVLTPDEKDAYEWLPDSCAYRRLANGQEAHYRPTGIGARSRDIDAGQGHLGKRCGRMDRAEERLR